MGYRPMGYATVQWPGRGRERRCVLRSFSKEYEGRQGQVDGDDWPWLEIRLRLDFDYASIRLRLAAGNWQWQEGAAQLLYLHSLPYLR